MFTFCTSNCRVFSGGSDVPHEQTWTRLKPSRQPTEGVPPHMKESLNTCMHTYIYIYTHISCSSVLPSLATPADTQPPEAWVLNFSTYQSSLATKARAATTSAGPRFLRPYTPTSIESLKIAESPECNGKPQNLFSCMGSSDNLGLFGTFSQIVVRSFVCVSGVVLLLCGLDRRVGYARNDTTIQGPGRVCR